MKKIQVNESTSFLEALKKADKIKTLNIIYPEFDISKYGSEFLQFRNLKKLSVQSHVSWTHLLPEEIGQIKSIKNLYILNVQYQEFPNWIFELSNLQSLMLRGNDIKRIPDQFYQLNQLTKLRIENCKLSELPISISQLKQLRQLSLSDNFNLVKLDPDSLPKKLRTLNIACSGVPDENISSIISKRPGLNLTNL